jgi:hypothetical protein
MFNNATGPGITEPIASSDPGLELAMPHGAIFLPGEEDITFWITDFRNFGGTQGLRHCRQAFHLSDLFRPQDLNRTVLRRMDEVWEAFLKCNNLVTAEQNKKFRWIHFPDNNVDWVQKMLLDLRAYFTDQARVAEASGISPFSSRKWFKEQTNSYGRAHLHARFMRPVCKRWASNDRTQTEMVLMLPYIHYEKIPDYWAMRKLVAMAQDHASLADGAEYPLIPQQDGKDRLFYDNLRQANRIQIRRSLDQSYYWTLKDSERRDRDQVIDRYAEEHLEQEEAQRALLMVDQMWLWLLNEDAPNSEHSPLLVLSSTNRSRNRHSSYVFPSGLATRCATANDHPPTTSANGPKRPPRCFRSNLSVSGEEPHWIEVLQGHY